jgi:hypothetical protein
MLFSRLVCCNYSPRPRIINTINLLYLTMNCAELLSELSKFPGEMGMSSLRYFDSITVKKDRVIFDQRSIKPYMSVKEAMEILALHGTKEVWFIYRYNTSSYGLMTLSSIYTAVNNLDGCTHIQFCGY